MTRLLGHLSIKTRLLGLVFLLCILQLVIGGMGWYGIKQSNLGLATVYQDRVVPLKQLKQIADAYAVDIIDAVNKTNAGIFTAEEASARVDNAVKRITTLWEAYLKTRLTTTETKLANEVSSRFIRAKQPILHLQQFLSAKSGYIPKQLEEFDGPLYQVVDPISDKIAELIDLQLTVAQQEYNNAQALYDLLQTLAVATLIVSLIIGLSAGLWLIGSIVTPLTQVVGFANRMARGDLNFEIAIYA
ncbi:MCP four helix bundle domain-containing protein [Methylocucumis oryzae]|uniref:MCP four helix bundle domain-containing protein n=1 Tax=Methylocucumis oryzae TaxID=1632867 RepID=UPI000697E33D|nr:MCP four helix bundle domain-containing protein [Methylocucumis oryzae]